MVDTVLMSRKPSKGLLAYLSVRPNNASVTVRVAMGSAVLICAFVVFPMEVVNEDK